MNIAKISLGGDWKMRQCADGAEYDAKVPGTVLSVLLEHGAIEDPFYRRNEYQTRELFRGDYEFSREFEIRACCAREQILSVFFLDRRLNS